MTGRTDGLTASVVRVARDADERPWEKSAKGRLDAEPHRGRLLLILATSALACGWLSCCLVVPSLIGLPLALAAYVASKRDLGRIRGGEVDRGGWGQTDAARD